MITFLRTWWCGFWHGHCDVFQVEPNRVYLWCPNCGRETPGWATHAFSPKEAQ